MPEGQASACRIRDRGGGCKEFPGLCRFRRHASEGHTLCFRCGEPGHLRPALSTCKVTLVSLVEASSRRRNGQVRGVPAGLEFGCYSWRMIVFQDWFRRKEIDAFATALAQDLGRRFPPQSEGARTRVQKTSWRPSPMEALRARCEVPPRQRRSGSMARRNWAMHFVGS